jgi:hypothetical protein
MTEPLALLFPEPLPNDGDDVAWALQTAQVQWKRGGQADAVVWLRRAADSADQFGDLWRAADLRRVADEFAARLSSIRPPFSRPPPASGGPPPASKRPPFSGPPPASSVAAALDGRDVDALLGMGEPDAPDSMTVPLPSVQPLPQPSYSYAPVDDFEVEVDPEPESFAENVMEETRAEAVSAVELGDAEIEDAEDDFIDDDVIDEVALGSSEPPLPSFASRTNMDPGALGYAEAGELEDSVTQPQLEELRLPASLRTLEPEPEEPRLGDVLLGEVRGLEDLPLESQVALVREAVIESLNADEEVSSFGLALVLKGSVSIMPAIADLSCARAVKGDIIWSQGNLEDGIALRLVAARNATEVVIWESSLIKSSVRDCPWVIDDLKALADRFQALAGVAMGPLGERLDDLLRATVTDRCEIKRLLPNEELLARGKPVGGMYIVAAGRIEIFEGRKLESELGPGDFLFAPQVLSNGAAPRNARAGKGGALVLFAGRSVAHQLLLSVPPLLEIFAS